MKNNRKKWYVNVVHHYWPRAIHAASLSRLRVKNIKPCLILNAFSN